MHSRKKGDTIVVTIEEDGSIVCLKNNVTASLLEMGSSITKRASHVEPDNGLLRIIFHILRKLFGERGKMADFTRQWSCLWRVNLIPVKGPILASRWKNRQKAIDAEIEWLNENFL